MNKPLLFYILLLLSVSGFAQAPVISSVNPAYGPVGSTVKITGSNFSTNTANNIVFFGATKAVVNSATSTQLSVTVPVGASCKPITVTSNSLTAFSQNTFVTTFSGGGLLLPSAFDKEIDYSSIPIYPGATKAKDIDGDGKADLILANTNSSTMSVFRNVNTVAGSLTTASFASKIDFTTGSNPGEFVIEDINGDGKPDIVALSSYQSSVNILKNTSTVGNISFATNLQLATGNRVVGLSVTDINGDGKPDIVVTNSSDNTFSVLINTSTTASISFAPKVDFASGTTPGTILAADFDGDGKPDLAIVSQVSIGTYGSSKIISVYLNTSNLTTISFAPKTDYLTNGSPVMNVGDLDGDGKPDLIFSDNNIFSVLRNISSAGNIVFEPKVDFQNGNNGYGTMLLTDIDGDGKLDVVENNGSTTFISKNTSTSGVL